MYNKSDILKQISEVEIFEKYIGHEIKFGRAIISPLREEKHPSFNIYQNESGKILFKDFSGERGDCFSFVMKIYNCSFKEALNIISHDFSITKEEPFFNHKREKKIIPQIIKKERKELHVQKLDWDPESLKFWEKYGVYENHLLTYNIHPLNSYSMKTKYGDYFTINSSKDNPIFCYDHKNGAYKIYRPFERNPKYKFVSNLIPGDIFGLATLNEKEKLIIITAGEKDAVSLFANTGIKGIALNSESANLSKDQYIKIMNYTDHLLVCYDNDPTGHKNAQKINDEYDIEMIDISEWADFSGKDISDMAEDAKTRNILRHMIKHEGYNQIRKSVH